VNLFELLPPLITRSDDWVGQHLSLDGPGGPPRSSTPASASLRTWPTSRRLGASPLAAVLVTHGHRDHASGAPAIAAAHPAASFTKLPWPEEDAQYDVPWRSIGDGDQVRAGGELLRALHTPGHSPDHLAFWHEASGTIFTGDLVVSGSSVMIHWSRGGDLGQYSRRSSARWRSSLRACSGARPGDRRSAGGADRLSGAPAAARAAGDRRAPRPVMPACGRLPNPS
jgi:glyoxylase-like metal-dependent hydrolase (beta-lactamase superfamily II)